MGLWLRRLLGLAAVLGLLGLMLPQGADATTQSMTGKMMNNPNMTGSHASDSRCGAAGCVCVCGGDWGKWSFEGFLGDDGGAAGFWAWWPAVRAMSSEFGWMRGWLRRSTKDEWEAID